MAAPAYFVSDLHLDPERPAVIEAFERFLAERRDAEALYILGDLFEFWVGDDDESELIDRVAHALRHFSDAGPALYLMHGNRDFLIGERFASRVGGRLLDEPSVVRSHHQQLLLMHGDSLCTRDEQYQEFRRLARSPAWREEILAKPLEERHAIARHLRSASRDAGSRKAEDIMDVTEREVISAMQEHRCKVLIHGHTHRPARHENSAGVRWVLGDWDRYGWYLRLDDAGLELIDFEINQ
jgi:UDP-2,3-diacylglucosamine hydrolase